MARGLVAPWRVESSRTRDQTHVLCTGRQIPNHWATRDVPGAHLRDEKLAAQGDEGAGLPPDGAR